MGVIGKLLPTYWKNKIKKKFTVHTAMRSYQINTSPATMLKGKRVVVTGGSGAIGRAICFRLAAEGAIVYCSGRSEESVMSVVKEMRSMGLQAEPFVMDVSDSKSIDDAFDSVFTTECPLDVLVNCAGGGARGKMNPLSEQSVEVIDEVLNVNLRGTMLCTRKAAQNMIQNKAGKIVVISSAVGVQGLANYSEYAAAKSGMFGFVKSMALELGKYGITVNCVTPGFIQRGEYSEEQEERLKATNCLHAVGTLEDVANAVLFMASDESKFITGQNLCVDGGRTLGLYGNR